MFGGLDKSIMGYVVSTINYWRMTMSIKKHYKLYKAGKQWCVAAITTAAIVAGMAGTIHADSNTSAVQTQPVEQEAKVSQNENNIKDNQVTDAKTSNQTAMVTDQTASADKAATGDTTNTPAANKDADQQSVSTPRASEATVESLPTGQPGWGQQNGSWYYFNKQGTASTGWQQLGNWYYFDPDNGQMQSGLKSINNKYYYLNPNHDGTFGAMQTGWQKIDNQWYGFGGPNDGAAYTNWHKINGRWYYFQNNGQTQTGWFQTQAGNWYYFDPENAWAMTGWQLINNNWYYFDQNNAWAQKGWMKTQAGNWYYFDPENAWADTGWQGINGNWYYFDQNNAWALTGWQWLDNNWVYFDPTNAWQEKGWQNINGQWYYFDVFKGHMLSGLQTISGHVYDLQTEHDGSFGAMKTGWQKVNNNWYYFGANGAATTGWYQSGAGKWYYFNNDGTARTGWQNINDRQYYFDQNNAWALTGWQKLDNTWHYFDPKNAWELSVRDGMANEIAQMISQQRNSNILADWTNQDHDYQELALHDTAQLLAQGDVVNDNTVIESLLEKNDLLTGKVLATLVVKSSLKDLDANNISKEFIAKLPSGDLNNAVLGVGYDTNKQQFGIILFQPGKSVVQDATSQLSANVSDTFKHSGVNVDVTNGLKKGDAINTSDLGDALTKVSPTLLKGVAGTTISQDVLKTIFAGLPGNTAGIEGTRTYYHDNDAYHYQFWLAGQSADDKLANFLALNKNAKYGDQLKVNYTATLIYGPEVGTAAPAVNETPASKKTSSELKLAYQKGTESGARYDEVKVEPIAGMKQDTIRGVDISSYLDLVKNGVQFYDFNGQPADLIQVLADAGVNYVRLRMWVDPYNAQGLTYGGGNDDEANVLEMAKEAEQHGMKVLLALHYSDFWADPAVQLRPKQWANLNDNELNEELYLYTKKIANDFNKAGVNIDMAQMGNEITAGFLGLRKGWSVWTDPTDSARLTGYLHSISKAFREESPATQLAIHIETPDYNRYDAIMGTMKAHNVDYDVLASSYYPFWGTQSNNPTNISNIEKMAKDKYGKKFIIAETGWPFTLENSDGTPNNISSLPNDAPYPVGPQGQVDELADAYKAVLSNDNGLGVFYWEPTWIPVKAGWDNWEYNHLMGDVAGTGWASINSRGYYPDSKIMWEGKSASGGSSWDNNTFFDDNGHPLQSLKMYNGFLNGYQSPANVTSGFKAQLTAVDNAGVTLANPMQVGDTLKNDQVLTQEGQQYLNGINGTSISQSSLEALFNNLQDGFNSANYTDASGNQYHYQFWLVGDNANDKLNHFLALNKQAKYGAALNVDYRAVLVKNPAIDQLATSPVSVKLSKAWGLNGVTITDPLKEGDSIPAADLAKLQQAVAKSLTGEKGTAISDQSFKDLANSLPGSSDETGALVGTKVYTMADGNQYHYEYWLTSNDVQAANQGAKYGDPINLTYSASLKWIDPKANN